MSESGEIYTAGKNFTLPLAVTALTNSTFDQIQMRILSMSSFAAFTNKYLLLLLAYCPIWCRRSCIIFFRCFSIRYKLLVYIFFLGCVFILDTLSMILCFNPSLFIWAFCPPGSEKTPFVFLLIFSKLILPQDFPTTELLGHSFSGIPNWWQVPIAISTFQIIFLCPMTRTYLQLKEAI